jgi:hypothetical protein
MSDNCWKCGKYNYDTAHLDSCAGHYRNKYYDNTTYNNDVDINDIRGDTSLIFIILYKLIVIYIFYRFIFG